jgi:AcrR family transcriptional regulator
MQIIVTEATRLFLDTGFVATKMDRIAQACKISKRTLYRLFPSKLDLFRAMVERHRESLVTFPADADMLPMEAALLAIFHAGLDPAEDRRRVAFLEQALAEAKAVPELGVILRQAGGERARILLADWLGRRKQLGTANIGDPHSAASILMDMVYGALAPELVGTSPRAQGASRQDYLADCIRYFVNGIK